METENESIGNIYIGSLLPQSRTARDHSKTLQGQNSKSKFLIYFYSNNHYISCYC